ncbi:hypothetical protein NDU88_000437 [Pleurodeles waltl]|uniref:Uncharacterized protein n=1 Tax=Pleurodeles waltl TaxID=8319 RepID=A0AAV7Q406_PLEWA|nr:hypothetical protein NDU88_000437 [Pleurodeles waltl]
MVIHRNDGQQRMDGAQRKGNRRFPGKCFNKALCTEWSSRLQHVQVPETEDQNSADDCRRNHSRNFDRSRLQASLRRVMAAERKPKLDEDLI